MYGNVGGCCCRPAARPVVMTAVAPNYGVAIIAIAVLILIALAVIF